LALEDDELLTQQSVLRQEISAAAGQIKQAASGNGDRGWSGPKFDVFVNPTVKEGSENEKVR